MDKFCVDEVRDIGYTESGNQKMLQDFHRFSQVFTGFHRLKVPIDKAENLAYNKDEDTCIFA